MKVFILHVTEDQIYTNVDNEFIFLLIRIVSANTVFANYSCRHGVWLQLSVCRYWKICVCKFCRI